MWGDNEPGRPPDADRSRHCGLAERRNPLGDRTEIVIQERESAGEVLFP